MSTHRFLLVRVSGAIVKTYPPFEEEGVAELVGIAAAKKHRGSIVTVYPLGRDGRRSGAGRRIEAPPRLRLVRSRGSEVRAVAGPFEDRDEAEAAALREIEDHPGDEVALYPLTDGEILMSSPARTA